MSVNSRVAVVFHSDTGATRDLALAVEQGARSRGSLTRLCSITGPRDGSGTSRAAVTDDLSWADAIVIGTPTLFGGVSAKMLDFLSDARRDVGDDLKDKVVTGFTVAGSANGGQEACLLSLCDIAHHWGAVVMPTGLVPQMRRLGGNPYGLSVTRSKGEAPLPEAATEAAHELGARAAQAAEILFASTRTKGHLVQTNAPEGAAP
ncbi:flavodoxin family protein [Nocardiopsis alba]|nr:flavodoxin family protein [Nocardiopsis alba]